jgi:hypothetical protein
MNEHGIEIDRMLLEMLCTNGMSTSDGACPNPQEADNCKAASNHDSWDKGLIIGLVLEIFFAIIEVMLLATTIYIHHRRIKKQNSDDNHSVALVKFNVKNEELQLPLLQETNNDELPVLEPRRSTR